MIFLANYARKISHLKGELFMTKKEAILTNLYSYHLLSTKQLCCILYPNVTDTGIKSVNKNLKKLKDCGLIFCRRDKRQELPPLYELTETGTEELRGILCACADSPMDGIYKTSVTYKNYPISEKLLAHQYDLNWFLIHLMKLIHSVIPNAFHKDGKDVLPSKCIRPDAIITIPGRTVEFSGEKLVIPETRIYVENDMGTESISMLATKFVGYVNHLRSSEVPPNTRILILFLCKNKNFSGEDYIITKSFQSYEEDNELRRRIVNVKEQAFFRFVNFFDLDLDVAISTLPRLIRYVKLTLRHDCLGLDCPIIIEDVADILANDEAEFQFKPIQTIEKYVRRFDKKELYAYSKRYQKHFIFMFLDHSSLLTVDKIHYFEAYTEDFRNNVSQDLYLVVISKKASTITDLNALCHFSIQRDGNILFTTYERLIENPFWKAVVRIGTYGNFVYDENMEGSVGLNSPVF